MVQFFYGFSLVQAEHLKSWAVHISVFFYINFVVTFLGTSSPWSRNCDFFDFFEGGHRLLGQGLVGRLV